MKHHNETKLERNSENEFELEALNVGQVNKIQINHANLSNQNRIQIEKVTILKEKSLFKFVFYIYIDRNIHFLNIFILDLI